MNRPHPCSNLPLDTNDPRYLRWWDPHWSDEGVGTSKNLCGPWLHLQCSHWMIRPTFPKATQPNLLGKLKMLWPVKALQKHGETGISWWAQFACIGLQRLEERCLGQALTGWIHHLSGRNNGKTVSYMKWPPWGKWRPIISKWQSSAALLLYDGQPFQINVSEHQIIRQQNVSTP